MKTLLRIEELVKFIFAYWASLWLGYSWWVFWAWLLAPDLSMLGYLVNTKVGAWIYNFFHHQALAIVIGMAGTYWHLKEMQLTGLVLFGHSAMDRAMGYGLKHEDRFQHTHLGEVGNKN